MFHSVVANRRQPNLYKIGGVGGKNEIMVVMSTAHMRSNEMEDPAGYQKDDRTGETKKEVGYSRGNNGGVHANKTKVEAST